MKASARETILSRFVIVISENSSSVALFPDGQAGTDRSGLKGLTDLVGQPGLVSFGAKILL